MGRQVALLKLCGAIALSLGVYGDDTIELDKAYPKYCAKNMDVSKIQPLQVSNANDFDLIQVQVVVRHGARTPCFADLCWNDYDEEWNCNIRDVMYPELIQPHDITLLSHHDFEKIYTKGQTKFKGNCSFGQMIDEGYFQQIENAKYEFLLELVFC